MSEVISFIQEQAKEAQDRIVNQVNRHRQDVKYHIGEKVYLDSRFIRTSWPYKKLDDKALGPYEIIEQKGYSYKLKLPEAIKVYLVFHI